jgi:tRNA threonylcarbamoyladenosine biosynthesis protein TsaB
MINLYIDTRDSSKITARIDKDGSIFEEISTTETRRPESILILIKNVASKAGIDIHDIDEIHAEEGPGSYTGLKVGISVANALSFSLDKKVNGYPLGEYAEPKYQ